jgi:hypothetical protein
VGVYDGLNMWLGRVKLRMYRDWWSEIARKSPLEIFKMRRCYSPRYCNNLRTVGYDVGGDRFTEDRVQGR